MEVEHQQHSTIVSNNRPQQQRTLTLGPSAPIQDWEVERITLLRECKEYRERAERLERKIEENQKTYEKNTTSILRELKMKETLLEKRAADTERQLMGQIEEMQRHVNKEQVEHDEEIRELRKRYDNTLLSEQKKHQRRIASLQERLAAKETEFKQLQDQLVPPSPSDKELSDLHRQLMQARHDLEEKEAQWQREKDKYETEISELTEKMRPSTAQLLHDRATLQSRLDQLLETDHQKLDHMELELEDALERHRNDQQQIARLERALADNDAVWKAKLEAKEAEYKRKLDQTNSEMQQLRERFMNENRITTMHYEARIQNLESEHRDVIRDIKDQFETEKEVWQIERQAMRDEMMREFQQEKENAIKDKELEWQSQLGDLRASMSKDSYEIQKHWQGKLDELAAAHNAERTRLEGAMEVVKDRLGKEIERRRAIQVRYNSLLEDSQSQKKELLASNKRFHDLSRKQAALQNQLHRIKQDYRSADILAQHLVSLTTDSAEEVRGDATLNGRLQSAINNVTRWYANGNRYDQTNYSEVSSFFW